MQKIINPIAKNFGGKNYYNVYCKIEFKDGKLSITGVEAPSISGNCKGSCGQILDRLLEGNFKFNKNWDSIKLEKFVSVWKEFHLNDMKAGTKKQREFLKQAKENGFNISADNYTNVCKLLEDNDLLYDKEYNNYKYGTAWLMEEVPEYVIDFLFSLPETVNRPAWV